MDVFKEIKVIQQLLGLEDVEIIFETRRGRKYPDAVLDAMNNRIVIYGTKTSLIRWALFEIILHEATHKKLKEMGYEKWQEHDDMFYKVYAELRKEYEDIAPY